MPDRLKIGQARFPLLDRDGRLAGWSEDAPHFERTLLRHVEAENLVGTPIVIVPALLLADAHVRLAGGTPSSDGAWVLAIAHANCIRNMPIVIRGE